MSDELIKKNALIFTLKNWLSEDMTAHSTMYGDGYDDAVKDIIKLIETEKPVNAVELPCNDEKLLEKTIAINGTSTQLDVAVEECSELIQAICKIKRYGYTDEDCYFNLAEEMADVEIVLAELKLIFGNEDDVKSLKCDKLARLEKRLKSKTDFDTSSGVYDLSE